MQRGFHQMHYVPGMSSAQARVAGRLEWPVMAAVLATVPVLVLASFEPDGVLGVVHTVLNWAIWLTFVLELVVMLRICPDRRSWLGSNWLDVLVVVVTPPFLPESFQVLWVLRLLRILDVVPVVSRIFRFSAFRYAAMLAFLAVFGGGLAYAELEEERGVDVFDGVWWGMTTISTVGYGDEFPETVAGRLVAMALMVVGPVLIGLVASGVASMVTRQIEADVEDVERGVEQSQMAEARILERLDDISARLDRLEERLG